MMTPKYLFPVHSFLLNFQTHLFNSFPQSTQWLINTITQHAPKLNYCSYPLNLLHLQPSSVLLITIPSFLVVQTTKFGVRLAVLILSYLLNIFKIHPNLLNIFKIYPKLYHFLHLSHYHPGLSRCHFSPILLQNPLCLSPCFCSCLVMLYF